MVPFSVARIVELQNHWVALWHATPITDEETDFYALVCQQHAWNFRLWHEEDRARAPHASDAELAQVKRSIDRLNQARNDAIEQLDDDITRQLQQARIACPLTAPQNTETPGSAVDRLSILALRRYHYQEQCQRQDADRDHLQRVQQRLELCIVQQEELSRSLGQLLDGIFSGRLRHRTYRQMKMYNDPKLNPYLYNAVPS